MPNLEENFLIEGFDVAVKKKNDDDGKIIKKKNINKKSGGFQSFGLSLPVIKGLQKRGYKIPTPIQRKTIPLILQGRDVVAMARTGSGKTACFLIPMFEKLKKRSITSKGPRALILSPTRELAAQTLKFIRELGKFTDLKAVAILGGDSINHQFSAVHENPDIIVATPGRFLHICIEMDLKLSSVDYIVFDEADRLFEMGFGDQIKETLDRLPEARQTLLFSATLPKLLVDFAKAGLSNPVLLRLDVDSKIPETLDLSFLYVRPEEKPAALICTLQALPTYSQTLVFAATKHHVEYLHMLLDKAGISNTYIYSDLDPAARKINTAKFRLGKVSVLIVTDLAARGVDIPDLNYVINYHFPAKSKLFVHRVGRCARAGRHGLAISLVAVDETPYVLDLHLFLGRPLNLLPLNPVKKEKENEKMAFGKIPEDAILPQHSEILEWHEDDDFASILKVCSNAYSKYLKSRPGASRESVRRVKDLDFLNVGIYSLFKDGSENSEKVNLLDQVKNYKAKGTIFELLATSNPKSFAALKSAKKAHAKQIREFHFRKEHKDEEEFEGEEEEEEEKFLEKINEKKRKNKSQDGGVVKKQKFKDEEYYVPHFAADNYTEKELAVNNFVDEANKATFDTIGDNVEGFRSQKQLKKWDKKKMRIVEVPNKKVTKIKTEAGNWISASYKSDLYAKWKERSRAHNVEASEDEDEGEEENENKGRKGGKDNKLPKLPNAKKRKWKNDKNGERPRNELKKPEQILKARKDLAKKKFKSLPRNVKNKMKTKNKGRR